MDNIERFKRPTTLPGDVAGWVKHYLAAVPGQDLPGLMADLVDTLRPQLVDDDTGVWMANYVRL